jgi:hypothetical protein
VLVLLETIYNEYIIRQPFKKLKHQFLFIQLFSMYTIIVNIRLYMF